MTFVFFVLGGGGSVLGRTILAAKPGNTKTSHDNKSILADNFSEIFSCQLSCERVLLLQSHLHGFKFAMTYKNLSTPILDKLAGTSN